MIIECNECRAKFKLDDASIKGRGVKVKCTKCENIFVVTPPTSKEEAPSVQPEVEESAAPDVDEGPSDDLLGSSHEEQEESEGTGISLKDFGFGGAKSPDEESSATDEAEDTFSGINFGDDEEEETSSEASDDEVFQVDLSASDFGVDESEDEEETGVPALDLPPSDLTAADFGLVEDDDSESREEEGGLGLEDLQAGLTASELDLGDDSDEEDETEKGGWQGEELQTELSPEDFGLGPNDDEKEEEAGGLDDLQSGLSAADFGLEEEEEETELSEPLVEAPDDIESAAEPVAAEELGGESEEAGGEEFSAADFGLADEEPVAEEPVAEEPVAEEPSVVVQPPVDDDELGEPEVAAEPEAAPAPEPLKLEGPDGLTSEEEEAAGEEPVIDEPSADLEEAGEVEEAAPAAKGGKRKLYGIVAVAVIVIVVVGFYFSGLTKAPQATSGGPGLAIVGLKSFFVNNEEVGRLFAVEGKVRNISGEPTEVVGVKVSIFDKGGKKVADRTVSLARIVSNEELKTLTKVDLDRHFKDLSRGSIPPRGTTPLMAVFTELPKGMDSYEVEVIR